MFLILAALALVPRSAVAQEGGWTLVLFTGDLQVSVHAAAASESVVAGEFAEPDGNAKYFVLVEHDEFVSDAMASMAGPTSSATGAAVSASGSASAAASASGGAAAGGGAQALQAATLEWQEFGAHAMDLATSADSGFNCIAGKVALSGPLSEAQRDAAGANEMADPRIVRIACMGWTPGG
jgi:hypothetical protein